MTAYIAPSTPQDLRKPVKKQSPGQKSCRGDACVVLCFVQQLVDLCMPQHHGADQDGDAHIQQKE